MMTHTYTLITFLAVFSRIHASLSQSTTVIPMAFKWEDDVQAVADIAGINNGLTTYLIHDRPYDATFSAADGLGGTITYVLGEKTASVLFIATDPNGGPAVTASGECALSGTKIGDAALCTTAIADTDPGGPQTTSETMTPATVTVGTVNTAAAGQGQSSQASTSISGTSTPTPTPGSSPAGPAQPTISSTGSLTGASAPNSSQPSSASTVASYSKLAVLFVGVWFGITLLA